MISGQEALARLQEGNRIFVASIQEPAARLAPTRRPPIPQAQEPFAIVLGCSDARVPAELVFGQGFGDLFVIRVAGNIVAPSQVGSVEFAATRFGTRLAVVLGHTQCGAIALLSSPPISAPSLTGSAPLSSPCLVRHWGFSPKPWSRTPSAPTSGRQRIICATVPRCWSGSLNATGCSSSVRSTA